MSNEKFTVDTHLFRELGELLVGRNSTALVELLKNAYDADATAVVIHGEHLNDQQRGVITIIDDGIGMNAEQFRKGFLRIASRLKDTGQRKSAKFKRRFTGAKGIGRLAAHKLARLIVIESRPNPEFVINANELIQATIDWDEIEQLETLDDVESSGAVLLDTEPRRRKTAAGTTITLKALRRKWSVADLVQFQSEVGSFRPPAELLEVPEELVKDDLLFDAPHVADIRTDDPGVSYTLEGDFDTGEDFWPQLAQTSQWLLEIDAGVKRKKVRIKISPTQLGTSEMPNACPIHFDLDKTVDRTAHFQARAFIREGSRGERGFREWLRKSSGIRVYFEGFRVLPYGEPKDDWLSLDADYKMRPRALNYLTGMGFGDAPEDDENEGLVFLGNSSYFGAVFLTSSGVPNLKMLVNREGFVADSSYEQVVEIIRTAIYLSVRVRAAAKKSTREERREQRQESPISRLDLKQSVEATITKAAQLAGEARRAAAAGDFKSASAKIEQAAAHYRAGSETSQRLMSEGAVLRVLASVGTQMAAFVHEINSILAMSQSIELAVTEIAAEYNLSVSQRKTLSSLRSSIGDLRRGIERQASYLTDVVSADARRRRSRQRIAERFSAGQKLIEAIAARRSVTIENNIATDVKSPPMFAAELTVVFSNLLTNAVKAAGEDGRIRATSRIDAQGRTLVKIENTGDVVEPDEGERWFKPFESTTVSTDPVLGQGMGMGLAITRNVLEDYGASIRFTAPSRGFATALEITFPK